MKYARYIESLNRRELWKEIVYRNRDMHILKYPELSAEITKVYEDYVLTKKILPSMRSLQFAGKPIDINPVRLYNCSFLHMNDWRAFSEVMFLLLSGVGVGYSVQFHHVEQLPEIKKPTKNRRYLIGDSVEGWSDAVKILIKSYLVGGPKPVFDFRDIRPKGSKLITSGGKAPGPEPLKDCLYQIEKILDRKSSGDKLTTVEVHGINCHIADAVLSGGIRRAALIALFSFDDDAMLTCKFGKWYETNPEYARANNTAVILRNRIKKDEFFQLWKKIEESKSGEPGFMFTDDVEYGLNPCAEVSLLNGQFCNLVTINADTIKSQEDLEERCKSASFIATLQAGYTNFHYLRDMWKKVTEKEALIGVSMTGISSGKVNNLNLETAVGVVKSENERVAKLIGINVAARNTVIKPEGTSSLVLGTSSGIHSWHDDYFIRTIRVGKNEAIYTYLANSHPELIEDDFFKPKIQSIISVPMKAPASAIIRKDETAISLLERVLKFNMEWIRPGHRKGSNYNNVSATITIKDNEWKEVGTWLWSNKQSYTALSFLPYDDHSYVQAPFQSISKSKYYDMLKTLHEVDLSKVIEDDDNTDLKGQVACAGNSCEII